jgi:hypothetical protein
MNLSVDFTRSPEFHLFKKAIGSPSALEYLFNLGAVCQIRRKVQLELPLNHFGPILGLPEADDPEVARKALLDCRLIEPVEGKVDVYEIRLFKEHNHQLIASWENGSKGGRPKVYGKEPSGTPAAIPRPPSGQDDRSEHQSYTRPAWMGQRDGG